MNGAVRRRYAWQAGPKVKTWRGGEPILTEFRGVPFWWVQTMFEVESHDEHLVTPVQP